ncbi:MAG: DUF2461 domain-containing protein [Candidatus Nanopelagicales bacterium]
MSFAGFPADAFAFYDQLATHNSRAWWEKHRTTYDDSVKAPMVALLEALEPEFGAWKIYRPYRDTRFSKDKTPLKDHQGAVVMIEDAVGFYVQLSASGVLVGGGLYAPAPAQLARVRAAIDSPAVATLEKQLAALRRSRPGWAIDMAPLKTRPKGVPADHPRLDLLRLTRLVFTRSYDDPATVESTRMLQTVRRDWRALGTTLEWLADHAGPVDDPGRESGS